jgi:hypothetical protein
MLDAAFKEFRLYCPICDHTFTQLIVLHKVSKNYDLAPVLADAVARHDHKAYQDSVAQRNNISDGSQEKAM